MRMFLVDYIHIQKLETDPTKFLRSGYQVPCLYESCLTHIKDKHQILRMFNSLSRFIAYVLTHYFSVEDDYGNSIISPEFRNPIPSLPQQVNRHAGSNQESNKSVLPYHFITQLRSILCPVENGSFADWKWAHEADLNKNSGSWFIADSEFVDVEDPDCVWRIRKLTIEEQKKYGCHDEAFELWSPVLAVVLYLKLQLPLRTYQVRMLDSGEADTYRYIQGKWSKNKGGLAKGTAKNPFRRGVFRQMTDNLKQESMTGLYINTNKTADRGKDEWSKGYTIPWEHPQVLYWLEKLRNWQEKYNPVYSPTLWTSLGVKHLGALKAKSSLKAMGSNYFLFRDASGQGDDRCKPVTISSVNVLWRKLLQKLESDCAENKIFDLTGNPLIFVPPKQTHRKAIDSTNYPMHSLRVSLITAYALEGGVPMAILSKCIAGHARLIMTLYYTKAGITYCTEIMDEATKRLMEKEQDNYGRWLRDKSYEQLEINGVYNDPFAIRTVMQAMQNGVSLVKDDKGFCPKGGWGCDSGGVYVNDDTGGITYGEVPGYPQKNCPRCRWFFSGPAFIGGLNQHWNHIQLQMSDVGEYILKLEGQINMLEDEQYECQVNDRPFLEQDKLNTLRKIHQGEYEKNNRHAEDSSATYRLIVRCQLMLNEQQETDGIQLVAVGSMPDVKIAINECSRLRQVLTAVAGSTIYPEYDVSKAVLQAGKAYDMMLASNGKEPVFFRLSEEELPLVVQQMTKLLVTETGDIENALSFIEGSRRLIELGLDLNVDIEKITKEIAAGHVITFVASMKNKLLISTDLQSSAKEFEQGINDAE